MHNYIIQAFAKDDKLIMEQTYKDTRHVPHILNRFLAGMEVEERRMTEKIVIKLCE